MEGGAKQQELPVSALYRPHLQQENPSFNSLQQTQALLCFNQCEPAHELDDSQLVGAPTVVAGHAEMDVKQDDPVAESETLTEVKVTDKNAGKRKRGRPPRGQAKPPPPKKKKDEEDVCFICFDGGDLVLCDRRGCPKAYHAACIKRDESFFRSRAKWNCGWHICSNCEKAAYYMCYTCTYSLCKGCIKDADILCVRGNKGFCTTCMRTVLLVEDNERGNKEMAQVDFDDKSSWEYLFKVYWIYLKGKLSLTLEELTRAKNPWKGAGLMARKGESSDELYDANDDKGSSSDSSSGHQEANTSKRRKTKKQPKFLNKDNSLNVGRSDDSKRTCLPEGTEWASKELLELVGHMKNGDTSVLSQFDVQALLLEYIKRNNLRDPRRKSQIICDVRLRNLFGKARVGHFEMLKLLESHFLIKEHSRADDIMRGGVVDTLASQVDADENNDYQLMMIKDKKRKTRKKGDERGPQTNLGEYAAIDVHNINLIYLRRILMENLIEDVETFQAKVVGSIVRIRISGSDQKQDMYRLVQVVGTSKVDVPYKIGKRTADVMLEILNLNKKEVISIDSISNQEFSEDECRRLRQSIKCGLVNRLTVGEIQEKAMALQAVRVNDWLETEILRLNHLRDRASEKGHRKELRECVEKLQLLNTPEERQRRFRETPEVHADPNMDPSYMSDEDAGESDDKKQDVLPRFSGLSKKGREPFSPRRGGDIPNDMGSRALKNLVTTNERGRNKCTTFLPEKEEGAAKAHEREKESSQNQGGDAYGSNCWEKPRNQVDPTGSVTGGCTNQAVVRSGLSSGVASETSTTTLSTGTVLSANNENDKIWHYQDPAGKIQGPFCMGQLRKWSANGFFPPHLRIWRMNEKQDDSILLTDAMNPQYHKEPPLQNNSLLQSQQVRVVSKDRENNWDGGLNGSMNATWIGNKLNEGPGNSNDATISNGNNELVKRDGWGSCSSSWSTPADIMNSKEVEIGSFSQGWDSLKGNSSWSDQPQVYSSLSSSTFSGKSFGTGLHQGREGHGVERWDPGQNHGNLNSHRTAVVQVNSGHSGQSPKENCRPLSIISSSSGWDSNFDVVSAAKLSKTLEQDHDINFPNLPSPTPKPSDGDWKGQAAESKQSVSSDVPVQDSGPSWSTASSLVGGGTKLPEVASDWGGYSSPTPMKPSVEEWDSTLASVSSLKPTEVASDHAATPTSESVQLTHSSPPYPTPNASSWQPIDTGPTEFSSVTEASVSDLLAEVEAMESLDGLPSPTSVMKCSGELTQGSKNDCFNSVEGLSPTPDPAKNDALSSTGDFQLTSQSTMSAEPCGASHTDVLDPDKKSVGHSSSNDKVEVEKKPSDGSVNQWEAGSDIQPPAPSTDVPVNQWEAGSDVQPPAPSMASWNVAATDNDGRAVSETTDTGWRAVQGKSNLEWGGPTQGNIEVGWESSQGMAQGNANVNWGTSTGNLAVWGGQSKYSGGRFSGPRDRVFQVGDSGFDRGRTSLNRQSTFGGAGGGGFSSRNPPKGQRVCKFFESGHCKKGASCDYLHP